MKKIQFKAVGVSILVTVFALGLLSACSDDDPTIIPPVEEDEFALEFLVVDPQGDPVEGIQLTLFNDHDFLQGKSGNQAAVRIPFTLETEAPIILYINDTEGDTVQTIVQGTFRAGEYQMTWIGLNEEDVPQHSGRYDVQFRVFSETGSVVFADSMGILLSQPDSDFFIGTSDAEGKILIEDKRIFPQLYGLPDMSATDENGESLGLFNVNTTMHAYYKDPNSGGPIMRELLDIGATTVQITQVWDPSKKVDILSVNEETNEFNYRGVADKSVPDFSRENSLGYPYPNPFN